MEHTSIIRTVERHFEETIACVALAIMAVSVFAQVVLRYGFNTGLTWSEELAGYCMVWAIYMGASLGVRERFHIRILVGVKALPWYLMTPVVIVADLLWLAFSLFMIWNGYAYLSVLWTRTTISPGLGVDQVWPQSIVLIGYGLMTVRLVQIYVLWARSGCSGAPGVTDNATVRALGDV